MTVIMLAVGFCVAHARCARLVPYVIGPAIALVIAFLRPRSGGSINPARQFGPAAFAGQTVDLWICLVAPILGVALGAWPHHLLSRRQLTPEVRVRASGESPDGRVAAVGVSRRSVGRTPAPTGVPAGAGLTGQDHRRSHRRGRCERAVACRAW
jgi:glycerol uptake facilitator protein/aquaporin Z